MGRAKINIHICLFIIFLVIASGCAVRVHISEIKGKPHKYQDRQVLVKGKAVETLSIPFIQKGMYQIDDNTGKIWIVSQKRMPSRGEKVTVKGRVKTGFTVRDRTFGTVIVEGDEGN